MYDFSSVRKQFPALARMFAEEPVCHFDGPAGSQVPRSVADAVADYLLATNSNRGAPFSVSQHSDMRLEAAHATLADFLGTRDPGLVIFGQNMTSLTLSLSRALARTWQPGDEIIVSDLDHDANVTPWVLAAQDAGATIRRIPVCLDDCTLDQKAYRDLLNEKTRLVAIGYASNATGTINPIKQMIAEAHGVGALTFVDAVHMAPHGAIDVTDLDCDFLCCSAYKFFGPHVGIMFGKRELLESITPYKLRPSPNDLPGRWMTGTQSHEAIVGAAAAVDYLAEIGFQTDRSLTARRDALKSALKSIVEYETHLGQFLLERTAKIPGLKLWGIGDPTRLSERVPTFSFTHTEKCPQQIARRLGKLGIYVWPGNHYALPFTEAAGLEPEGTLRVGLLHYNTREEVARLCDSLERVLSE